jgi:hypothetical protein
MSAATLNLSRSEWLPGQVTVNAKTDFRLVMEGGAHGGQHGGAFGGFAIDQLVFSPGECGGSKSYFIKGGRPGTNIIRKALKSSKISLKIRSKKKFENKIKKKVSKYVQKKFKKVFKKV